MDYRILVVGAGGIGCELLKVLVQTGIRDITIIDLDTVEFSNLNRQFLFRKSHLAMPKAIVAASVVKERFPQCTITAFHDDIKSEKFDISFFHSFAIVLNALDNNEARSYVNKMCMLVNIPLIDGGTAGFSGQVHVFKRGLTGCFDCEARPSNNQSYPVCTIRNRPKKIVHCVVWAKYLFEVLFFAECLSPDSNNFDIFDCEPNIMKNYSPGKEEGLAKNLIRTYFHDSIKKQLECEADQIDIDPLLFEIDNVIECLDAREEVELTDNTIFDQKDYFNVFFHSAARLIVRRHSDGPIAWEKDDDDIMNFVTAACNLRAKIFYINMDTRFNIKSIAGSIIPSVATTNAVVASLMVGELLKITTQSSVKNHSVYVSKNVTSRGHLLKPCFSDAPNINCPTCCQDDAVMTVNVRKNTLLDIIKVVKSSYDFTELDIYDELTGNILVSSDPDDPQFVDLDAPLESHLLKNGSILNVQDFESPNTMRLVLCDRKVSDASKTIEIISSYKMDKTNKKHGKRTSEGFPQIGEKMGKLALDDCVINNE